MQSNYKNQIRIKNDEIAQFKKKIGQLEKANSGLVSDISSKTAKIR